ncbi:MAG: hypothetical protein HeimC3_41840, partial [Candidatus Heimdallarchaeota archaeon LC_3]
VNVFIELPWDKIVPILNEDDFEFFIKFIEENRILYDHNETIRNKIFSPLVNDFKKYFRYLSRKEKNSIDLISESIFISEYIPDYKTRALWNKKVFNEMKDIHWENELENYEAESFWEKFAKFFERPDSIDDFDEIGAKIFKLIICNNTLLFKFFQKKNQLLSFGEILHKGFIRNKTEYRPLIDEYIRLLPNLFISMEDDTDYSIFQSRALLKTEFIQDILKQEKLDSKILFDWYTSKMITFLDQTNRSSKLHDLELLSDVSLPPYSETNVLTAIVNEFKLNRVFEGYSYPTLPSEDEINQNNKRGEIRRSILNSPKFLLLDWKKLLKENSFYNISGFLKELAKTDKEVRKKILENETFWHIKWDYWLKANLLNRNRELKEFIKILSENNKNKHTIRFVASKKFQKLPWEHCLLLITQNKNDTSTKYLSKGEFYEICNILNENFEKFNFRLKNKENL